MAELISPSFLFITGDRQFRHSNIAFGMLGTLSIVPLFHQIRKKQEPLAVLAWVTIASTVASAALVDEYHPHALRSCLCWPAYVILLSLGWSDVLTAASKRTKIAYMFLFMVQLALWMVVYYYYGIEYSMG